MIVAVYRLRYICESFKDAGQHTVSYGLEDERGQAIGCWKDGSPWADFMPRFETYAEIAGPFAGSYTAWTERAKG